MADRRYSLLNHTHASSGGGGAWGDITGTLSDQTDLQTALDLKSDISSLSIADWNTAFGWDNHASAGYLTDAASDGNTYGRKDGAWAIVAGGGGISSIVEDTTPELGGNLDTNGKTITGTTVVIAPSGTITLDPTGSGNIDCETLLQIRTGKALRILSASNAQYATFSHNGTDFNTTFISTTEWNINKPIKITGAVTATGGNSGEWNTAFGWGNHASTYELLNAKLIRHISSGYNAGSITVSSSAPGSPSQGDIWFDTS